MTRDARTLLGEAIAAVLAGAAVGMGLELMVTLCRRANERLHDDLDAYAAAIAAPAIDAAHAAEDRATRWHRQAAAWMDRARELAEECLATEARLDAALQRVVVLEDRNAALSRRAVVDGEPVNGD
jgi:hypothetical protein